MHPYWQEIFGNDRRVEVEIGSGTGTFLLPAAAANPQVNFLGIEKSRGRASRLEEATHADGLRNVIVINADARCIVEAFVPAESVDAYHVYFPDPWWKHRHHRRRLFTQEFAAALARTLRPGGVLYLATDVPQVIELMLETLASVPSLRREPALHSPRLEQTAFERKGLRSGASIHDAAFVKLPSAAPDHANNAAPITPAESPS